MASRRMARKRTITGSLTDIQKRLKYVEGRSSPSRLANQVVRRTNVQPRAISTDQIALSSITNSLIEAETIGTSEIGVDAITNSELAVASVDTENFVVGAVDNAALGTKSVTQDKLDDNSVGTLQILNGAVSTDKIDNNAVTTSKILDGAIETDKLDDLAVVTSKIGPGAIVEGKVAINAINTGAIQGSAITTAKLSNGAVTSSKIGSNQVQTANIANSAVTGDKIANQTITAINIGNTGIATFIRGSSPATVSSINEGFGRTYVVGVRTGTGSNEAAAGNHDHGFQTNSVTRQTQIEDGHRHSYTDVRISNITVSSKRHKKNISAYKINDPEALLRVEPKKFQYKSSKKDHHQARNKEWILGYIAEEFEEVGLEDVLIYDKEGRPDAIDYSIVSLVIVEIIKLHQAKINYLEQELERLKEER